MLESQSLGNFPRSKPNDIFVLDIFHLPLQIHLPTSLQALYSQEADLHGLHQWVSLLSIFLLNAANQGPCQEIWGWDCNVYFPYFLPVPSSSVWLCLSTEGHTSHQVALKYTWSFLSSSVMFWFYPFASSSLGWYSPSVAKHKGLYHLLPASLIPSYMFRNNVALLLFHEKKPCGSCQDPKPHFSWRDAIFFPLCLTEEIAKCQCWLQDQASLQDLGDDKCFAAKERHVKPDGLIKCSLPNLSDFSDLGVFSEMTDHW